MLEPVIPVPKDHLSQDKAVAQQSPWNEVPLGPHTHGVTQQPQALWAHELAKKPTHQDEKKLFWYFF